MPIPRHLKAFELGDTLRFVGPASRATAWLEHLAAMMAPDHVIGGDHEVANPNSEEVFDRAGGPLSNSRSPARLKLVWVRP